MLESVRQFLQARLVESGEADSVRARHFSYFLALAERLAPRLALGDGPECLARLEAEHDNLDTALEWGDGAAATDAMLRFTTALTLFWELRGHLAKGGRWFARVLRDDDAPPTVDRARALWGAAHVALYGDDFETMQVRAPQALAMAEAVGDDWAAGRALNTLGFATVLFDPEAGRTQLARSIELGRASGDDWAVADGWKMTTVAYYIAHDEAGAAEALEQLRRVAEAARERVLPRLVSLHGRLLRDASGRLRGRPGSVRPVAGELPSGRRPFDRRVCRGVRPRCASPDRRSRRCRGRARGVDRPRQRGGRRVRAGRGGLVSRRHRARDR